MRRLVCGWFLSLLFVSTIQAAPVWAAPPHRPPTPPWVAIRPAHPLGAYPGGPRVYVVPSPTFVVVPIGSPAPVLISRLTIIAPTPAQGPKGGGGVGAVVQSWPSQPAPAVPVVVSVQRIGTSATFTPVPRAASGVGAGQRVSSSITVTDNRSGSPRVPVGMPSSTHLAAERAKPGLQITQTGPPGTALSRRTVSVVAQVSTGVRRATAIVSRGVRADVAAVAALISAEGSTVDELPLPPPEEPAVASAGALSDSTLGSTTHGGTSFAACLAGLLLLWSFFVQMKGPAPPFWRLPRLPYPPPVPPG